MEENTPLTEAYIHIPSGWMASADEVRRVDEDDDYDDHDDQSVAAADDDGDALKNCDVQFQRCNIFRYVFFFGRVRALVAKACYKNRKKNKTATATISRRMDTMQRLIFLYREDGGNQGATNGFEMHI